MTCYCIMLCDVAMPMCHAGAPFCYIMMVSEAGVMGQCPVPYNYTTLVRRDELVWKPCVMSVHQVVLT